MTGMRALIGAMGAAAAMLIATGLPVASADPADPDTVVDETVTDEAGTAEQDGPELPVPAEPGGETGDDADGAGPAPSPPTDPEPAESGAGESGRADKTADDSAAEKPGDRATEAEDGDEASEAEQGTHGELRVATGPIVVTAPAGAGAVLTALMDVTVTDTRRDAAGWSVDVRAGQVRSTDGVVLDLGAQSYYRAGDTACSSSTGTVPLSGIGVVAAVAAVTCPHAGWTAELGIAVPADAPVGDYRLTITHSVY